MTKIDIISGFLGAGKTTFIKKMLKEAFAGEQVVLIENEFGEIGIDGGFLKEAGIEIKEMNSGCICCSLVGDFGKSLKEVVETYHPDRILIEPSGVGKLSDVIKAVQDAQEEIEAELNSFVTVVDVTKCRIYSKNFGEFFSNQIEYAGTIILSRTDKAKEAKVNESVAILRELNEKAPIITTPVEQLSGAKLLEIMEGSKSLEEELLAEIVCPVCGGHHDHEHHHHDHEEECHCHEHEHHHHDHDEECHCHDHEHHHHDHGEECHCHDHEHDHEQHHHDHGEECEHAHEHHHSHEECEHYHEEKEECKHHHHHDHDEECDCHEHEHHHHHDHDEECDCHEHHHHHDHDEECGCGCGHDHHHGHHHADEVFTSWGRETIKVYTKEEISNILKTLEEDDTYGTILRAKGMVAGADGEWIYFDMVPEEHEVRTGAAEYTGRLCVIGAELKEDKLEELFGLSK